MFRTLKNRVGIGSSTAWLAGVAALLATTSATLAQECVDKGRNPQKNVYWGDLHTHTSYSFDAVTIGVRTTPRDAYNFAKGVPIGLPPYDENGQPLRMSQLARPLDFLAVTDHSEYFGEVRMCLTCADPEIPFQECRQYAYNSVACKTLRNTVMTLYDADSNNTAFALWGAKLASNDPRRFPFCGRDGFRCLSTTSSVWEDVQRTAAEAYQPCEFTSFVAYEWTGTPFGNNWHRNVIFRNEHVPGLPVTYFEAPADEGGPVKLWSLLEETCLKETPGCEFLAIPHNSNVGQGIFPVPGSAAEAQRQGRFEPLAEIHQTKGNSECRWGVGTTDEECQFELLSKAVLIGNAKVAGPTDYQNPAQSPLSAQEQGYTQDRETGGTYNYFLRETLKAGLYLGQGLGINPYKLGFVGGTDTHNSTPGAVEDIGYNGQHGLQDDTIRKRLSLTTTGDDPGAEDNQSKRTFLEMNPGGLTAVWAEENTRNAIFGGLRGKETYASSGIRPVVRFFGGWDYPADICQNSNFAAAGYQGGVPMGSDIKPPAAASAKPRFAVMAMKDPDSDLDSRLQRIQIVKGWIDVDGQLHEQVHDVASSSAGGSYPADEDYVDLNTCDAKPGTPGQDSLCAVWQDDAFDPAQSAFYYARVLQNPTCRWSTYQCLKLRQEDPDSECWKWLDTPANAEDPRPGVTVGYTTQERAWTSSIWYEPPAGKKQD